MKIGIHRAQKYKNTVNKRKKIVWKVGKMVDEFYEWLRGKKIEF